MDLIINNKFQGYNIYEFFKFYQVSKSLIYKLETNKWVLVNHQFVKFNYCLQTNDVITLKLSQIEPNNIIPFRSDIDIVYEDDDILIVNKPPFLLVHSDGNTLDTLANRVSFYATRQGYEGTIKHIHRIDYETSGMVIFAKHFLAHSYLAALFASHDIHKTYVCLCHNRFTLLTGQIKARIGKDRHENKQRISSTGKEALSIYRVIENGNISRVEVDIVGGRKHQIRVHMASIKHPLVGDKLYGSDHEERLLLHFQKVTFIHPRSLVNVTFVCKASF